MVYSSKLLINNIYYSLQFRFLHKGPQSVRSRQLYIHWQPLILSLALCYYFRLPTRQKREKKEKKEEKGKETAEPKYDRTKFAEEVDKKLWEHCPEEVTFKKIVDAMLNAFYSETLIPGSFLVPFFVFFKFYLY